MRSGASWPLGPRVNTSPPSPKGSSRGRRRWSAGHQIAEGQRGSSRTAEREAAVSSRCWRTRAARATGGTSPVGAVGPVLREAVGTCGAWLKVPRVEERHHGVGVGGEAIYRGSPVELGADVTGRQPAGCTSRWCPAVEESRSAPTFWPVGIQVYPEKTMSWAAATSKILMTMSLMSGLKREPRVTQAPATCESRRTERRQPLIDGANTMRQ